MLDAAMRLFATACRLRVIMRAAFFRDAYVLRRAVRPDADAVAAPCAAFTRFRFATMPAAMDAASVLPPRVAACHVLAFADVFPRWR